MNSGIGQLYRNLLSIFSEVKKLCMEKCKILEYTVTTVYIEQ